MKTYAIIIKHPFRDNDWRVDVVKSDKGRMEVWQEAENKMLGPFQVVSVTEKVSLPTN